MKNRNNQILRVSKLLVDIERNQNIALQAIEDSRRDKKELERVLMELELMASKPYKSKEPEKN
jgi:hypothetical protein